MWCLRKTWSSLLTDNIYEDEVEVDGVRVCASSKPPLQAGKNQDSIIPEDCAGA